MKGFQTMKLTIEQLAKYVDHTNLKAEAAKADIQKTCEEAAKYIDCLC